MTNLRFAVHCRPYVHNSAGIRATHMLAPLIEKRGYKAVTITPESPPTQIGVLDTWVHVYCDNDIPHAADSKVVRWWLGHRNYNPSMDELQVAWMPEMHPGSTRLMLDTIDRSIFYPKIKPGKGIIFYNGKGPTWVHDGKVREVCLPNPSWRHMTRHEPKTHAEVGDWLREAEVLVVNDSFTALTVESLICGTPVLPLTPTLAPYWIQHLGMMKTWDDLESAKIAVKHAAQNYDVNMRVCKHDVDDLIERCRARWGS